MRALVRDETRPKLPIGAHRSEETPSPPQAAPKSAKSKMRFNWRANWEILLVLVIISIGIVITTIAAIRSKGEWRAWSLHFSNSLARPLV